MLNPRPSVWPTDNWHSLTPTSQNMVSRSMLACADGSYLPLIAKCNSASTAQIFEIDSSLCPDVQFMARKLPMQQATTRCMEPMPKEELRDEHGTLRGETREHECDQVAMDYQKRIDAILAERLITRHTNTNKPISNRPDAPTDAVVRYNPRPLLAVQPSGSDAGYDNKEYCTYWIRTGECDYVQQGCRYKHEMPSLGKLKTIGFMKGFPRWWLEKVQYERPAVRARHNASAFRRMVDAHLQTRARESRKEENSSDDGGTEVDEPAAAPAVRKRVVTSMPLNPSAPEPALKQETAPVTVPSPAQSNSQLKEDEPTTEAHSTRFSHETDLLDLISDSESDSLPPPLKVPHNSPDCTAFRRGRFIAYNETITTTSKPANTTLRSPSPLQLDSHPPAKPKTAVAPIPAYSSLESPRGYEGKNKRIQELEAELSALRIVDVVDISKTSGLAKSKYAPQPLSSSIPNSSMETKNAVSSSLRSTNIQRKNRSHRSIGIKRVLTDKTVQEAEEEKETAV